MRFFFLESNLVKTQIRILKPDFNLTKRESEHHLLDGHEVGVLEPDQTDEEPERRDEHHPNDEVRRKGDHLTDGEENDGEQDDEPEEEDE